jgi:hypothetical protein
MRPERTSATDAPTILQENLMFALLALAVFALGFIYAAGASRRTARQLPTESGDVGLEAKLLASAANASDHIGMAKDKGTLIAKRNSLKLLAATANAAAAGTQRLSVSVAEQTRREEAMLNR